MIKIGMMIGDRYEILEKIGTGGMSDVYKAKCHKLNRFVAVKVLKQEFSENANFVSKFRIEAQAAAGLMHPNIVNVYDVGEENGIYYIVMELVEGITLKRYIEKKARLSYREALSIAIQVSMGIEAAHNNHIIHRDIKPQNIIISKEGKVKVTDFGIAKAATSNTITSNVMGSVHYTSPEQARGGYSDEKSDIYSLGITLFEMLTGRVPFNGETTVAIAIKHIQEEMVSPREYVPEIPVSVEGIVLKCCEKSPDRRYQSMKELLADLKYALMHPDEDFVERSKPEVEQRTRMVSDLEVAKIKRKARGRDGRYREEFAREAKQEETYADREAYYEGEKPYPEESYGEEGYAEKDGGEYYAQEEEDGGDEYDYNPKMERITTFFAVFAGVVICGIVLFLLTNVFHVFGGGSGREKEPSEGVIIGTDSGDDSVAAENNTAQVGTKEEDAKEKMAKMPNVVGWNVNDAVTTVRNQKLEPELVYEESEDCAADIVFDTDVEAGREVPENTVVTLYVSTGPAGVALNQAVGKTREDAEKTLTEQEMVVEWREVFSETAPGVVISQDPPAGTVVPPETTVYLTVSKGSQENTVPVPNVIGMSGDQGLKTLEEAGFVVKSVSNVKHPQIPEGLICYQSYSAGSYVPPGTVMEIHVSLGPASYSYSGNIAGPSPQEAPEYTSGSEVNVVITLDSGQEIYNVRVTSFPLTVNFYGVPSAGATVAFNYTVTVDGENRQANFTRRLEFTEE